MDRQQSTNRLHSSTMPKMRSTQNTCRSHDIVHISPHRVTSTPNALLVYKQMCQLQQGQSCEKLFDSSSLSSLMRTRVSGCIERGALVVLCVQYRPCALQPVSRQWLLGGRTRKEDSAPCHTRSDKSHSQLWEPSQIFPITASDPGLMEDLKNEDRTWEVLLTQ